MTKTDEQIAGYRLQVVLDKNNVKLSRAEKKIENEILFSLVQRYMYKMQEIDLENRKWLSWKLTDSVFGPNLQVFIIRILCWTVMFPLCIEFGDLVIITNSVEKYVCGFNQLLSALYIKLGVD